jgi:hypothetical protein
LCCSCFDARVQAARQDKIALGGLVLAVEKARSVPSAASSALAGIKFGIADEAACFTAAIMAGPRSLAVRVSRDAKVARMIGAGLGTIFDEVGNCSLRT